jgi:hypothetical protein
MAVVYQIEEMAFKEDVMSTFSLLPSYTAPLVMLILVLLIPFFRWSIPLLLMKKWRRYKNPDVQDELINRRERARAFGIGSGDPRYPDIWDVLGKEPPKGTVPHREKLVQRRKELGVRAAS